MKPEGLKIRDAQPGDRQRLANMMHFELLVHRHLDWQPALEWIGTAPFVVLEKGNEIQAALACPPDPPNVPWIRLFSAGEGISADDAWRLLWQHAYSQLVNLGYKNCFALALQDWFVELLQRQSARHTQDVIVLGWSGSSSRPTKADLAIRLRRMGVDDLAQVGKVDAAAFVDEWRNSPGMLRTAFREAALATVAEIDGQVIGYQISTTSPVGGHLARLAVLPDHQGRGVGKALVTGVLDGFTAQGIQRVTVNTQTDNLASLAIYQQAGFLPTGDVYPVFLLG